MIRLISEVQTYKIHENHCKKQFIFNLCERIFYPRCTQVRDSSYITDKYCGNSPIRSKKSTYWESPFGHGNGPIRSENSIYSVMGNTQYGDGHVTIFSDPTSHQKSTSIIDLFTLLTLSQSTHSLILISELILAHRPLLSPLRWVLIFLLLLLFLNSFNSSVLLYILSRWGSVIHSILLKLRIHGSDWGWVNWSPI
jgi:hypothetical protein